MDTKTYEHCEHTARRQRCSDPDKQKTLKSHTSSFQNIVLPWCKRTCALNGIELLQLHAVHRAFLLPLHNILYLQKCLQSRMFNISRECQHHNEADDLITIENLGLHYRSDCLFRGFLRHCTLLKGAPVISGSFAVAEYLRSQEVPLTWRPNDIDIFTDSIDTFEWMIYRFNTTVMNPLNLKYSMRRACLYQSDHNQEIIEHDHISSIFSESKTLNAAHVRKRMAEMLHEQRGKESLRSTALQLRPLLKHIPSELHPQKYEIQQTARYHFQSSIPTLIPPNFILIKPHDMNTLPLEKLICSSFDLTLCGVWLKVSESQEYEVIALPDTTEALIHQKIKWRPTAFSLLCTSHCTDCAILASLKRIRKYMDRGFSV